jgi:DNA-damage-inducible protein J
MAANVGATIAPATELIEVRVDTKVKQEAAAVLADMGLTISDAIRVMLIKTATERDLPFNPLIPNAETIAAMEEARLGGLRSFDTIEELMADLHAED